MAPRAPARVTYAAFERPEKLAVGRSEPRHAGPRSGRRDSGEDTERERENYIESVGAG